MRKTRLLKYYIILISSPNYHLGIKEKMIWERSKPQTPKSLNEIDNMTLDTIIFLRQKNSAEHIYN